MTSLQAGVAYVDIHPNLSQFDRTLSRGLNTKLGGVSRAIGKGLKFAAIGFTAVGAAAGYAFKQFEDSEKIGKQTEAVIKSTGGAANVTADQIGALADKISAYSGIDDEAVQAGENMLLTFTNLRNEAGKGNDVFTQATGVLTDLATALGSDPQSAAIQLGKALNDPIRGITALRRVGVAFNTQQEDQIKKMVESGNLMGAQKLILKELTKEFGGSAKAQATASGKMKVALQNLAEDAGKLLAPALTVVVDKVTVLAGWLGDTLPGALKAAQEWFMKVWTAIKPAVETVLPMLQDALKAVWEAIKQDLWPALKDLWQAAKPVLKVLGLIVGVLLILALKILPVAIRIIGKLIGFNLRLFAALFKVYGIIGRVGLAIGNAVKTAWDFVVKWGGKIIGWFKDLPGKAASAIASLPGKVGDVFKGMINLIIGWWNRLDLGFHIPSWVPGIGGKGIDDIFPDVPLLASGGIVRRPTMAMIGEAGPEAILPLRGRGQLHVIVDNPHDFGDDGENVRHDQRMARTGR